MYVCAYIYVDIYAHLYTPTQISYYGKYCILNCIQNWKNSATKNSAQLQIIKMLLYSTNKNWDKNTSKYSQDY